MTALFIASATFSALTSINDRSAILSFLLNTGDCVVVGLVMSLLGLRWKEVHNYSLMVIILVHGISACI